MMCLLRRDILSAQSPRLYKARLARFSLPGRVSVVINDPPALKAILSARAGVTRRAHWIRRGLAPIMGNGVFLSEGNDWTETKQALQPLEKKFSLDASLPALDAARARMQARLSRLASDELDLEDLAADAMLEIVFVQLFSSGPSRREREMVRDGFRQYQNSSPFFRIANLLPDRLGAIPAPWSRRRRSAVKIRRVLEARLRARQSAKTGGGVPEDGLNALMVGAAAHGKSQRWIVDQLSVFVLAGHETGAAALSWALYLLAAHPEDQTRVAEEAGAELKTDTPTRAQLSGLRFATAVFRETLRLYPPLPMLARRVDAPVTIAGQKLSVGDQVVVSLWHLHRHERVWDNPHAFCPERWDTKVRTSVQPGSYLPFSSGPRSCPAAALALAEGSYLLAIICRLVVLSPVAGDCPVPAATMTTRSRDGIRVRAQRREAT